MHSTSTRPTKTAPLWQSMPQHKMAPTKAPTGQETNQTETSVTTEAGEEEVGAVDAVTTTPATETILMIKIKDAIKASSRPEWEPSSLSSSMAHQIIKTRHTHSKSSQIISRKPLPKWKRWNSWTTSLILTSISDTTNKKR